jgi:hypothetical protein
MRNIVQYVLAFVLVLISACSSIPKSVMVVPSRSTVPALEKLSHQSGATVEVLTVDRAERRLTLDGTGGTALTGRDIDIPPGSAGAGQTVRIPFDDLALVYYSVGKLPDRALYPNLPNVGPAEQGLSCEDVAIDLGRAETIRWFARQQGARPYTAHQAAVEHTKNTLGYIALTAFVIVAVAACGSEGGASACGGFGGTGAPAPIAPDAKAFRWAVTAADRRIVGLLAIKREHQCATRVTATEAGSDLAILERIEASRAALRAKQIDEEQQMDQQTMLLDKLDPPPPKLPVPAAPSSLAAEIAAATAIPSDREAATPNLYDAEVDWYADADGEAHGFKTFSKAAQRGHLTVTKDALGFLPNSPAGGPAAHETLISIADLADATICQFGVWRGVVITRKDGHKDTFGVESGSMNVPGAAQEVSDLLKSRIPATAPDVH